MCTISIPSPFHFRFALLNLLPLSCRQILHTISFVAVAIKQKFASHSPLLTSNRKHRDCNMNASDEDSVCNKSNTITEKNTQNWKNEHTKNIK